MISARRHHWARTRQSGVSYLPRHLLPADIFTILRHATRRAYYKMPAAPVLAAEDTATALPRARRRARHASRTAAAIYTPRRNFNGIENIENTWSGKSLPHQPRTG